MKLIIDINDNEYISIKEYPDNIMSYPVTIHIYDAIRQGIPLEDMINKIKDEIEQRPYGIAKDSVIRGMKYERSDILEILGKYNTDKKWSNTILNKVADDVNILKKVSDGTKVYVSINDVFDIIDKYRKEKTQPNDKALKIISETMMDMINGKP